MNARLLGATALVLALGGCASFTPDAGLGPTTGITRAELNKDVVKVSDEAVATMTQDRAEELLRRPLTPDSAVQIAILKNRGLQAAFNDLGVAEAIYVKATLPPAPRFSASRLAGSFELEIERQILIGLFDLATLPQRAAIAEQRFRAAQFRTAEAVLRLAAEARRQYYRTVAANQQVGFLQQALATAESASELAKQLGETGALNKLEQAREHAFYTELGAQLARARIQQKIERERLVRQLGLWGRDIDFRLPGTLPPLPGRLTGAQEIEQQALQRRVDLEALRYDLHGVALQYGLSQATRFVTDRRARWDQQVRAQEEGHRRRGRRSRDRAREGQAARPGGRVRDPDLRLRPGQPPQRAGDLYGGGKPPRRARRQRPLGST